MDEDNLIDDITAERDALLALLSSEEGFAASATETTITAQERGSVVPLSFAQQRLWFLQQWEPDSPLYTIATAIHLQGKLHLVALQQSLNEIIRRHEILRTRFAVAEEQAVQIIAPTLTLPLAVEQAEKVRLPERATLMQRLAAEEAEQPFELQQGPLLRVRCIQIAQEEHLLLITMHHSISDGWSMGVFFHELELLYNAFVQHKFSPLPPLPIQYADFALWQRQWLQGERLETHIAYWKQQLHGIPDLLPLPVDRPRPKVQTHGGAIQSVHISQALTATLKKLSQQEQVTLFMLLLATFQVLLLRYSQQEDIVVGTPIANRSHDELAGLIGFFSNTLVIRTDLSGNPSFRELLKRVRDVALDAYAHQDLPFEKLVEELRPTRSLDHTPLFQVMFSLQNTASVSLALSGLTAQFLATSDNGTAKYDVNLELKDTADGVVGYCEYSRDLFDAPTIHRLIGHYHTLLEAVAEQPDTRLYALPLLTQAEQQQLLIEWNMTRTPYPHTRCIHELVEEQVTLYPDSIAAIDADSHITYQELNRCANQLAHILRQYNVGLEVRVGLYMERSLALIISQLAILKTGGAYVPLDPTYPHERLAFMLADAQVGVLLVQQRFLGHLPSLATPVLCFEHAWSSLQQQQSDDAVRVVGADNLAYVIYTSGSTGQPKGVAIPHRAVVRLVRATNYITLTPSDTLAHLSNTSFDAATLEVWGALLNGGRVMVVPQDVLLSPPAFAYFLRERTCSAMFITAALFNQIVSSEAAAFSSVNSLLVGGEALDSRWIRHALQHGPPRRLLNGYGPTENTTFSACYLIEHVAEEAQTIPIGFPIANTQAYVLDRQMQPVPIGVLGELYVAGAGLARGYLNQPDLTAEKFVPHPHSEQPGVRLYRTGDLVRYRENGAIEFVGRVDHQIKLRGFRIELGEIEAVLQSHPEIQKSVVLLRQTHTEERQLVAYIVPHEHAILERSELHSFLRQKLPSYMHPSAFMLLETLPLTPNGKVDRQALPDPETIGLITNNNFVVPRTPTEKMLADIWCRLLGREQISIYDNFFELGGHSLLATQVVSRIREALHIELSVRGLFEAPTIAALAEMIAQSETTSERIEPTIQRRKTNTALPLSFAQQRLWFLQQWETNSTLALYNITFALHLSGPLNRQALHSSLSDIVRRHEALRTTFAVVEDMPIQVIAPGLNLSLATVDLRDLPRDLQAALIQQLTREQAQHFFDLTTGPLLHTSLLWLSPQEHVLFLVLHHIIADGWSMDVFFHELSTLYDAFSKGLPTRLPELPIQYADFALWQREWLQGAVLEQQLAYWRQKLAGAPTTLELPTDHLRSLTQSFQGAEYTFTIPAELTAQLKALSYREGTTLFMTTLAAFTILLSRYSGQDDLVISSPIANRTHTEIEGLIGCFINTLLLRIDMAGASTFKEVLARVQETALEAYAHQDLPFERLIEELAPERTTNMTPFLQILFKLQNDPKADVELAGLAVEPLPVETITTTFDITLLLIDDGQDLRGALEYRSDLFEVATIQRMMAHYLNLLAVVVATPEQPLTHLSFLTAEELAQVFVDPPVVDQPASCLHHLFEAQVERDPLAIALIADDRQLSYGDLNARSNQLAHALRDMGLASQQPIALLLTDNLLQVIAMLAVLKAGCSFVCLEPAYPEVRLRSILAELSPPCFIIEDALLHLYQQVHLQAHHHVVVLDTATVRLDAMDSTDECYTLEYVNARPITNPAIAVDPADPAYIAYTSGSTGRPKGIVQSHGSFCQFLIWQSQQFHIHAPKRIAQWSALTFDASYCEILGTLCFGATLCMTSAENKHDPARLLLWLNEQRISLLQTVPSFFRYLVYELEAKQNQGQRVLLPSLETVLLSGEVLPVEIVRRWRMQVGEQPAIWNLYGPSEAVLATCYQVQNLSTEQQSIPIGRAFAGRQILILDENQRPCPFGA
ncbi:MAG TPA: amino acid adenylation domain-containing protein, partial [Ktedonobacteraceae bacterium]|nr:amino acid adenylation domain-containing protein [Ktedonobacteraceae bacterium]